MQIFELSWWSGSIQTHWERLQPSPDPLAGLSGEGRGVKDKGEEGRWEREEKGNKDKGKRGKGPNILAKFTPVKPN